MLIYGAEIGIANHHRLCPGRRPLHLLRLNAENVDAGNLVRQYCSAVTTMAARYKAKIETSGRDVVLVEAGNDAREAGAGQHVAGGMLNHRRGGHRRRPGPCRHRHAEHPLALEGQRRAARARHDQPGRRPGRRALSALLTRMGEPACSIMANKRGKMLHRRH